MYRQTHPIESRIKQTQDKHKRKANVLQIITQSVLLPGILFARDHIEVDV